VKGIKDDRTTRHRCADANWPEGTDLFWMWNLGDNMTSAIFQSSEVLEGIYDKGISI